MQAIVNGGRVALAALMVGLSRGVLEFSVPYAKEREAFERHVRSLMAKKARKDAARAAVALAAHERTVERASRRKAEIDARRGLAARTAERRQRRSASTSPAPDLGARTAGRRRAASTSPVRPRARAAPDDLAARTAERRRRARR